MLEADIRPANIFNEYLRLSTADADSFLKEGVQLSARNCPGCDEEQSEPVFKKNGFQMVRCIICKSLYASPAPTESQLRKFYQTSKSSDYWAKVFFPAVAEVRRDKIFRPRVEQITKNLGHWLPHKKLPLDRVIDVGAGSGVFLEEALNSGLATSAGAVEPSPVMAENCREKGIDAFGGFAADAATDTHWRDKADLVTCFEVIEHIADPKSFFEELAALAKPGGTILVTGLGGDGFDIQTLGKEAKAVSPPHHLNFISQTGIKALLARVKLQLIEYQTPGELDVDIVANTLKEIPDAVIDPFIRNLVTEASQEVRDAFQNFLQQQKLSSHMWVIARKPS